MDEIAALVVRLLFDDEQFQEGVSDAQQGLQGLGRQLTSVSDSINRNVTRAFVAGTAAVVGFTTAAVAIGATFDREIRVVGALLGEGEEGFQRVSEEARRLGATTQFTATQAAGALQNLARAGFSSFEVVAAAGPALDLATAAASDLSTATAAVAASLAQFQLDAARSGEVADVLANAAANTKFSLEGLTVALRQAGPAGQSVGLSIQETVAAVSQFRNIGLEASQAGTIFRNTITRLVNPSEQAVAVIRQLGLELSDVDPTRVPFDVLLQRLVDAGAGTREFAAIFGRFGLQIQSVAQTVGDAEDGFRALADAFEETGVAGRIAEEQSQNVLTQLQILRSGIEEVFLTVFDVIRGPLLDVISAVQDVVEEISLRFRVAGGEIEESLQGSADAISAFLTDAGGDIADTFVDIARGVSEVVARLPEFLDLIRQIGPQLVSLVRFLAQNLDFVVIAGGITLVVTNLISLASTLASLGPVIRAVGGNLVQLGSGMSSLATSVSGAAAPLFEFGGALSGLSGGFSLTIAGAGAFALAIAGATFALVEFISAAREAERAQRLLAAQQEGAQRDREAQIRERQRLAQILDEEKERARELLETGGDLSDARRAELREITSLNAAQLQRAIALGRIVETAGGLQFTAGVVRELGEEGAGFLRDLGDESERAAGNLAGVIPELQSLAQEAGNLEGIAQDQDALAQSIVSRINRTVTEAQGGIQDLTIDLAAVQQRATEQGIGLLQAVEQEAATVASEAEARRRRELVTATALQDRLAEAVDDAQQEQTQAQLREAEIRNQSVQEEVRAARQAAEERIRINKQAAEAITEIRLGEEQELVGFLPEPDQIRARARASLTALEQAQRDFVETFQGTDEQLARVLDEADTARALLAQRLGRELLEAERDAAQAAVELAREREDAVTDIVSGGVDARVQLERQAANDIRRIEELAAQQRIAVRDELLAGLGEDESNRTEVEQRIRDRTLSINEELAAQILAIRARLNDDIEDLPAPAPETRVFFPRVQDLFAGEPTGAVRDLAESFGESFRASIVGGLAGVAPRFASDLLAGFRELGPILQRQGEILRDAIEEFGPGLRLAAQGFATVIQGAVDTVRGVLNVVDRVSGGLISGFDPIGFVEDIPTVAADAADEVERAAQALAEARERGDGEDIAEAERALQEARQALRAAERDVASGSRAREIVDTFINGALEFTNALADNLDDILLTFAQRIPEVLQNIAAELPAIFDALAEALPDIITAIAENIGPIVEALIEGVAEAAVALAERLPTIIGAVLESLPGIIDTIGEALPAIITALAEALPGVIDAIAEALPEIVASAVGATINVITAITEVLPDLILAAFSIVPRLREALIEAVPLVIDAFVQAIPGLVSALIRFFPELAIGFVFSLVENVARFVDAIVFDLIAQLPRIALQLVASILKSLLIATRDFVKFFADVLLQVVSLGILGGGEGRRERRRQRRQEGGGLFRGIFSDEEGRGIFEQVFGSRETDPEGRGFFQRLFGNQGGLDFVPRTMVSTLHPGEAVLTADQNFARLFGGMVQSAAPASPAGAAPALASGGGPMTFVVPVSIGGVDIDTTTVRLDQAGRRSATNRMNRRKNGTFVGLERRR